MNRTPFVFLCDSLSVVSMASLGALIASFLVGWWPMPWPTAVMVGLGFLAARTIAQERSDAYRVRTITARYPGRPRLYAEDK